MPQAKLISYNQDMNQSGETPRFDLPAETPDMWETGVDNAREAVHEAEKGDESAAGKQQPQLTPPPQITTAAPVIAMPTDDSATTDDAKAIKTKGDKTAQDVDLIEKHWVEGAKKIEKENRDDPHKQKTAMSKYKADYIKKRFNKEIPTEDTPKASQLPAKATTADGTASG